ncbi:MAG: hypothetical protein U9Q69_03545 [Nanoarchaeota archaeon]|nr:hypothetical protein [Nanoarchaeota archaeon]
MENSRYFRHKLYHSCSFAELYQHIQIAKIRKTYKTFIHTSTKITLKNIGAKMNQEVYDKALENAKKQGLSETKFQEMVQDKYHFYAANHDWPSLVFLWQNIGLPPEQNIIGQIFESCKTLPDLFKLNSILRRYSLGKIKPPKKIIEHFARKCLFEEYNVDQYYKICFKIGMENFGHEDLVREAHEVYLRETQLLKFKTLLLYTPNIIPEEDLVIKHHQRLCKEGKFERAQTLESILKRSVRKKKYSFDSGSESCIDFLKKLP